MTNQNDQSNAVAPGFEKKLRRVRAMFFARNPRYWPCFRDPVFHAITAFRKKNLPPPERLAHFPGGRKLHQCLLTEAEVPRDFTVPGNKKINNLLKFAGALSKDWENPASVENVITMPVIRPFTAP